MHDKQHILIEHKIFLNCDKADGVVFSLTSINSLHHCNSCFPKWQKCTFTKNFKYFMYY